MMKLDLQKVNKINKNILLLSTFVISQIPSLFFGTINRLNLALVVERSTRLDFFAMYYANAINFLILAYCLHYNSRISKKVTLFMLIVTTLDMIHLIFFAMQGYGMSKIGIAIIIYIIITYDIKQLIKQLIKYIKETPKRIKNAIKQSKKIIKRLINSIKQCKKWLL